MILLFGGIGCLSFGQEIEIKTISFERLSEPISLVQKEDPSQKYQLMEVNLTVDVRQQALRKSAPILELPKEQFIAPLYNVSIPQPGAFSLRVSGSGFNNTQNNGGVKNIAYKDAGFYSGAFCSITGLAY